MRIVVNEDYIHAVNKLVNENIALKKQINEIHVKDVAKEVAVHLNKWLDDPYEEGKTLQQDIDDFSLRLTKYIDHRLRD